MESQLQTQVLGVEQRMSKNGQHTMYDVLLADGQKYTTFDYDLATQAQGLQGQAVSANVSLEQKGKYTNRNLEAIGPQGALPAPAPSQGVPLGQVAAQPLGAPQVATPGQFPMAASSGGGPDENDKARMSRLSAAATAFNFVGALFQGAGPEAGKSAVAIAEKLAETITAYGMNGTWGGAAPAPVAATPQAVAAAVPGVEVGVANIEPPAVAQPATADDIPWD